MLEVQILVVLFALHSQSRTQAAEAKSDTASGSVNSPCTEARYHHQLAKKLQSALDSATGELSKYAKLPTAYRIAAAQTPSPATRMALTALSINADVTAATALSQLQNARAAYARAIKLLSARVAKLRAVHELTPSQVTHSNTKTQAGQTLSGVASLRTCEADVQLQAADAGNCSLETDKLGDITAANIDLATATQIKLLSDTKIKIRGYKLIAAGKATAGSADTASTTTHGFCAESGQHNSPSRATNVIAGQLTLADLDQTPANVPYFEHDNEGECKKPKADGSYRDDSPETLAAALCAVKKTSFPTPTAKHKIGPAALYSDTAILTILSDLNSPGSKAPKTEQEKKALIHKFFPQDPATFKTEITDAVETTEIAITLREKQIKGTPIALAGTTDGAEVLAYYLGKDLAERTQEKASANKPTVAKELSDKCTAITDKDKCKTTDGCDLQNDKCVAKFEEKGTAETQNTTGSNSFVINKAPLLLAVLLF
uniref:Variant surface glycoprotein MITat1.7 n=1 Tax=Trypanosoma brucei brucei TaxID=5702 RepID=Q571X5_TRYBB|nr:variant surface glycoprotein MITat1.7 [Trypanosoma brucei brucei]